MLDKYITPDIETQKLTDEIVRFCADYCDENKLPMFQAMVAMTLAFNQITRIAYDEQGH